MNVTDEMVKTALKAYEPYIQEMSCPNGMKAAIEAAIQAAWVSVGERLPEKQEPVIVRTKLGEIYSDSLRCTEDACWYKDGFHGSITHWMTLPEFKEQS